MDERDFHRKHPDQPANIRRGSQTCQLLVLPLHLSLRSTPLRILHPRRRSHRHQINPTSVKILLCRSSSPPPIVHLLLPWTTIWDVRSHCQLGLFPFLSACLALGLISRFRLVLASTSSLHLIPGNRPHLPSPAPSLLSTHLSVLPACGVTFPMLLGFARILTTHLSRITSLPVPSDLLVSVQVCINDSA